jgi:16S rRNA (cytosine967-C5)-methyltransferase
LKLHQSLIQAVAEALQDVFLQQQRADKVVERLLRSNPKWGSRDRAFIAESTYDIVRHWRKIAWLLSQQSANVASENPNGWTTQDWQTLVGIYLILRGEMLPNWAAFEGLDAQSIIANNLATAQNRALHASIPDWLDERGQSELGDIWATELAALNQPTQLVLRANTLKTNVLDLQQQLQAQNWASNTTPLTPDALVCEKRGNIFANELFKAGNFEVQDAGSQCIAPFLGVEPTMRVVDACAGAGGKSLHFAALMHNKGRIIALDTEDWKLEELRRRARRNDAQIIETRVIDSTKIIKRLYQTADRVLLDVPCSGLGVLRRNPDAKWKLSPESIDHVRATQQDILQRYCQMVRIGGRVVYATCSILPSENQEQVKKFLAQNPNFEWLDERILTPAKDGFDGFYMALLTRKA